MTNDKPRYLKLAYPCPYCQDSFWFKIISQTETQIELACHSCNVELIGVFKDNMQWKDIYVNRCESGFYDQKDPDTGIAAPELTVVKGFTCHWLHKGEKEYPRPELDKKKYPQSEVYEGVFSASGFYLSTVGRFGFVSDRIYVTSGEPLRAKAMYMHEFNGPKIGGGSRLGIVQGDGPFDTNQTAWPINGIDPFEDGAIVWGVWRSTYKEDTTGYLANREWVQLSTPDVQGGVDFVRLVVQFNANVAAVGSHGHWDVFTLQAYTDENIDPEPQPEPGDVDFSSVLLAIQGAREEIAQAKAEILTAIEPTVKITDFQR